MRISRCQDALYALLDRGVLPVIILSDESTACVADLEDWIRQWINNSCGRERGANGSYNDSRADRSYSANNKSGDENVIATLNKTTAADIQNLVGRWFDGHELRSVKVALKNGAPYSSRSEP